MNPVGAVILESLQAVAHERQRRRAAVALLPAVEALKQFQHQRLARSYADLLASTRHGAAARFFLDDLYGPHDFTRRDAQFARVVPALTRMLPAGLLETVARLARLHALSESLDSAMASQLIDASAAMPIDAEAYASAWRHVGRRADRAQQIALVGEIGAALDHFTHVRGLRRMLHLMRVPARAAGLAELQRFLERGFDTFHAMHGAQAFLETIASREAAFAASMFDGDGSDGLSGDGSGGGVRGVGGAHGEHGAHGKDSAASAAA